MKKYNRKFWFTVTAVLSIIFALLFYNYSKDIVGDSDVTIYTILGVLVIWIVYFILAYVFSKIKKKD